MRKLWCSVGIALLATWGSGTLAEQRSATETSATGYVQPAAQPPLQPSLQPAVQAAPLPAAASAQPGDNAARAAEPAPATAGPAAPPAPDPMLLKLKATIKSVRLSLADTSGRLAVTEKDLATANADNTRLRSENTNLHTNLAKAEVSGKKAEDEVAVRRQEVRQLTDKLASSSGRASTTVVLALTLSLVLAGLVFGQGNKVRRLLARLPDSKAEEKRLDQLRTQLKDEQQKAMRLDEECKQLREASNRQTLGAGGGGSKKDKIEQARRELREVRAAAEAQKRDDDEKIAALEAARAAVEAELHASAEKIAALEAAKSTTEAETRADDERILALEAEVERLTAANQKLDALLTKAHEKLTFLGHEESSPDIHITPSPV